MGSKKDRRKRREDKGRRQGLYLSRFVDVAAPVENIRNDK